MRVGSEAEGRHGTGKPCHPRLLVDLSTIAVRDDRTGIQRVVRALWTGLRAQSQAAGWCVEGVFATSSQRYRHVPEDFTFGSNLENRADLKFVEPMGSDFFLALDLAPRVLVLHERQLAEWKARGVIVSMIVYDILALTAPRWFTRSARSAVAKWFQVLFRQADHVLCISNTVLQEVAGLIAREAPDRADGIMLHRMELGADIAASVPSVGATAGECRMLAEIEGEPFALMVGTIEPRKGHAAVLKAFERIWLDPAYTNSCLVIAGRPGWRTRLLQRRLRRHRENGRRLFWFSEASDETLTKLYSRSSLLVMASYGEGFGLPLAEGLAHGCRILARNIPVFREMGAERLTYFDGDDPVMIAKAINHLLHTTSDDSAGCRTRALPTWQDAAKSVFERLSAARRVTAMGIEKK